MVQRTIVAAFIAAVAACPPPCVAQSTAGVTLLDFSLPTCRPCRQMDPVVAQLESEGFDVRRIDGSRTPQLAQRFGVDKYPTFIVLAGGREVRRMQGAVPLSTLRQMMAQAAPAKPKATTPLTFASSATGATIQPIPPIDVPGAAARTPAARRAPGAGRAAAPAPAPIDARLLSCSVRLKAEDATGHSYGTGTIVDTRQGEALVLTCAHLLRDSDGEVINNPRSITVEIYESESGRPLVVERTPVDRILSCNFESDVAFVSIRLQSQVRPARIASAASYQQGDQVRSVGCDHGADPSIRSGSITAINRYTGTPNVTASGAPVVGRSGGGLFDAEGQLVGVCNAADYEEDEGIYAALPAVHAELDKMNLSAIYRDRAALAATPRAKRTEADPTAMVSLPAVVRGQSTPPPTAAAGLSATERAALLEIAKRAEGCEVVCIVRPKSPEGRSQVLTLQDVSPEFIRALTALAEGQNPQ